MPKAAPRAFNVNQFLWGALGASLVRLWVFPLSTSFWLDETLTASSVRDGPAAILNTWDVRYQPVVFSLFEWVVSLAGGTSEIALRLPSLLAGIASLFVLTKIGSAVGDRETGLIAAFLFATWPQVLVEIPNARPYSLALLFSLLAILWLVKWLQGGRRRDLWLWSLCSVVAACFHSLFVILMAIEAAVALFRERRAIVPILAGFVALLPLAPLWVMLARASRLFDYWPTPVPMDLLKQLSLPLLLLAPLLIAIVLRKVQAPPLHSPAFMLAVVIGILPPVALYVAARLFGVPVFTDRYLLIGVPGLVIVWAIAVRGITSRALRIALLVLALINVTWWSRNFGFFPDYRAEDWRAGVARAEPGSLTLLYSGLAECNVHEWLTEPPRWPHLAAPVHAYNPRATPENTWLIPFDNAARDIDYSAALLQKAVAGHRRIALLVRAFPNGQFWLNWFGAGLTSAGYQPREKRFSGRVAVVVFERAGAVNW